MSDKLTFVFGNMGKFLAVLKYLGYAALILSAILAYFHKECKESEVKEELERQQAFKENYDKNNLDLVIPLTFAKKDEPTTENTIGLAFILVQSCPCAIVKFISWMSGDHAWSNQKAEGGTKVPILNARKHKPGTFQETGFTLVELDQEPAIKDWRTRTAVSQFLLI